MDKVTKLLFVIGVIDLVIAIVLSVLVLGFMDKLNVIEYTACYDDVQQGTASPYCDKIVEQGMP